MRRQQGHPWRASAPRAPVRNLEVRLKLEITTTVKITKDERVAIVAGFMLATVASLCLPIVLPRIYILIIHA
jgi:hypothetical protein